MVPCRFSVVVIYVMVYHDSSITNRTPQRSAGPGEKLLQRQSPLRRRLSPTRSTSGRRTPGPRSAAWTSAEFISFSNSFLAAVLKRFRRYRVQNVIKACELQQILEGDDIF